MSDNGELREDLKVPEGDLGSQLKSEYDAGKELLVSAALLYFSTVIFSPRVPPF